MAKHQPVKRPLESWDSFCQWVRLKHYQFEITFAINVYTPMEKLVFWSIIIPLFTIISFSLTRLFLRGLLALVKYLAVWVFMSASGQQRHRPTEAALSSAPVL